MVGLATANRHLGRLDRAIELAMQALELAREAGYRILEGHAGSALAEIQLACGRPDQAAEHAARRSPSTARPGTGSAKLAPSASSATPSAAPREPTPRCRTGMRRSPSSPTPAQPPKPTPSATSWRPPATRSAPTGRLRAWLVRGVVNHPRIDGHRW
jgi:hypothetical protein